MPDLRLDDGCLLHYTLDDYTDPWTEPEAILLLHGLGESGAVWFGWVPHLARRLRIVRPDMRGFGASTAMPAGFAWSIERLVADFVALIDALGFASVHLVGAKLAGTVARALAARHPQRVRTLTVVGSPPPLWPGRAERLPGLTAELRRLGVAQWARHSMGSRLGERFPAAGIAWWSELMGATDLESQIGFMSHIECADISADLPRIACPTLVITSEGSGVASVEETRAWQQRILRSELLVVPGSSYHVAASDSDLCARETLAFIERHAAKPTA